MATLQLYSGDEVDINLDIELTINGTDENINTTISHSLDDHISVDLSDRDILDALDEEAYDLDFLYEWMQDGELHNDFIDYLVKNELSAEDTDTLIVKLTRHKQALEFKKAQEELAGGDDDSAQA